MYSEILLSIKLSLITSFILVFVGTFIAYFLVFKAHKIRILIEPLLMVPIILPSTVLGFYLLVFLNPESFLGKGLVEIFGDTILFNFSGLVFASLIYSLPFGIIPLMSAFESIDRDIIESNKILGISFFNELFYVLIPMSWKYYLTSMILVFAHTMGEFGLVLLIGGNIYDQTRVVSIAIYDYIESFEIEKANELSFILLIFSFIIIGFLSFLKNYKTNNILNNN